MQKCSCIHTLSTSRTALTLLLTATAAQAAWADSAFSGGTEAVTIQATPHCIAPPILMVV